MDRAMLQDHLAIAERHIAEGNEVIARQANLIEHLRSHEIDTTEAEHLLANFKSTLAQHIHDRDRLRTQLGLPSA